MEESMSESGDPSAMEQSMSESEDPSAMEQSTAHPDASTQLEQKLLELLQDFASFRETIPVDSTDAQDARKLHEALEASRSQVYALHRLRIRHDEQNKKLQTKIEALEKQSRNNNTVEQLSAQLGGLTTTAIAEEVAKQSFVEKLQKHAEKTTPSSIAQEITKQDFVATLKKFAESVTASNIAQELAKQSFVEKLQTHVNDTTPSSIAKEINRQPFVKTLDAHAQNVTVDNIADKINAQPFVKTLDAHVKDVTADNIADKINAQPFVKTLDAHVKDVTADSIAAKVNAQPFVKTLDAHAQNVTAENIAAKVNSQPFVNTLTQHAANVTADNIAAKVNSQPFVKTLDAHVKDVTAENIAAKVNAQPFVNTLTQHAANVTVNNIANKINAQPFVNTLTEHAANVTPDNVAKEVAAKVNELPVVKTLGDYVKNVTADTIAAKVNSQPFVKTLDHHVKNVTAENIATKINQHHTMQKIDARTEKLTLEAVASSVNEHEKMTQISQEVHAINEKLKRLTTTDIATAVNTRLVTPGVNRNLRQLLTEDVKSVVERALLAPDYIRHLTDAIYQHNSFTSLNGVVTTIRSNFPDDWDTLIQGFGLLAQMSSDIKATKSDVSNILGADIQQNISAMTSFVQQLRDTIYKNTPSNKRVLSADGVPSKDGTVANSMQGMLNMVVQINDNAAQLVNWDFAGVSRMLTEVKQATTQDTLEKLIASVDVMKHLSQFLKDAPSGADMSAAFQTIQAIADLGESGTPTKISQTINALAEEMERDREGNFRTEVETQTGDIAAIYKEVEKLSEIIDAVEQAGGAARIVRSWVRMSQEFAKHQAQFSELTVFFGGKQSGSRESRLAELKGAAQSHLKAMESAHKDAAVLDFGTSFDDRLSEAVKTAAAAQSPFIREPPLDDSYRTVANFWSDSGTDKVTVWGKAVVVNVFCQALERGFRRIVPDSPSIGLEHSMAALSRALYSVAYEWEDQPVGRELWEIFDDENYASMVDHSMVTGFLDDDEHAQFEADAMQKDRLHLAAIRTLVRWYQKRLRDRLPEEAAMCMPDIKIGICVRSQHYGGFHVVFLPEFTDYEYDSFANFIWLCNEDAKPSRTSTATSGFSAFDFGTKWTAVALPGAPAFAQDEEVAQAISTLKRDLDTAVLHRSQSRATGGRQSQMDIRTELLNEIGQRSATPHVLTAQPPRSDPVHGQADDTDTPKQRSALVAPGRGRTSMLGLELEDFPVTQPRLAKKSSTSTLSHAKNMFSSLRRRPKHLHSAIEEVDDSEPATEQLKPGLDLGSHLDNLRSKYGAGQYIYIGDGDCPPSLLTETVRKLVLDDREVRKSYLKFNDAGLNFCLETTAARQSGRKPHRDAHGWANPDGPCDECRFVGDRLCAVLVTPDVVLIKGRSIRHGSAMEEAAISEQNDENSGDSRHDRGSKASPDRQAAGDRPTDAARETPAAASPEQAVKAAGAPTVQAQDAHSDHQPPQRWARSTGGHSEPSSGRTVRARGAHASHTSLTEPGTPYRTVRTRGASTSHTSLTHRSTPYSRVEKPSKAKRTASGTSPTYPTRGSSTPSDLLSAAAGGSVRRQPGTSGIPSISEAAGGATSGMSSPGPQPLSPQTQTASGGTSDTSPTLAQPATSQAHAAAATATGAAVSAAQPSPAQTGNAPEQEEEDEDQMPGTPLHYGVGEPIYVGELTHKRELYNAHRFTDRTADILTKIRSHQRSKGKPAVKDPDKFRQQNLDTNKEQLKKCMATSALNDGSVPKWTNTDGPCDYCEEQKRQCVVMLNLQWVWFKGDCT